jgi:hypothetical protein
LAAEFEMNFHMERITKSDHAGFSQRGTAMDYKTASELWLGQRGFNLGRDA